VHVGIARDQFEISAINGDRSVIQGKLEFASDGSRSMNDRNSHSRYSGDTSEKFKSRE